MTELNFSRISELLQATVTGEMQAYLYKRMTAAIEDALTNWATITPRGISEALYSVTHSADVRVELRAMLNRGLFCTMNKLYKHPPRLPRIAACRIMNRVLRGELDLALSRVLDAYC